MAQTQRTDWGPLHTQSFRYALYAYILHNKNNIFSILTYVWCIKYFVPPLTQNIFKPAILPYAQRPRQLVVFYIYTVYIYIYIYTYTHWTPFRNELHISSSKRQLNTSNISLTLLHCTICIIKHDYVIFYIRVAWKCFIKEHKIRLIRRYY